MTYEMINRRFTDTVTEWIAKGYHINTASMGGSQGEVAHIDLTDGREIIRIVLKVFCDYSLEEYFTGEGLELIVGRCADRVQPDSGNTWGTIWNNNLDPITSEQYYQIGREKRKGEKWYGTREDAVNQSNKHFERYKAREGHGSCREELPEKAKAIVLPYIKRQPKCSSMTLSRIASVEKVTETDYNGSFRIYFEITTVKGRTFRIL